MRRIYEYLTCILFFSNIISCKLLSPGLGYDENDISRTVQNSYKIIFEDDFDGTDINTTNWRRTPPMKKGTYGYWENDCSYIENGNLIIEEKAIIKNDKVKLCSGSIDSRFSKNDYSQGLYEIRFKIENPIKGAIYAFWFLTESMSIKGSNEGTEIDFFEVVPNEEFISSAIHFGNYYNNLNSRGKNKKIYDDFYNNYHILQFFWDKYGYEIYLDYIFLYRLEAVNCGGIREEPGHLRISAEYNTWGRKNFEPEIPNIPSKFSIDYVKVYIKNQ